ASISGLAAVDPPCAPESYDLTGTAISGGDLSIVPVTFTTNGPRPPEGPCPGGSNVAYSGQITMASQIRTINPRLSARGVTSVTCPQFGEHQFTYLINGSR